MKFVLEVSDKEVENNIIEINSLEELLDFVKEHNREYDTILSYREYIDASKNHFKIQLFNGYYD